VNHRVAGLRGLPVHNDATGVHVLVSQPNALELRAGYVGLHEEVHRDGETPKHLFLPLFVGYCLAARSAQTSSLSLRA
jgi:hypothetical protein